MKIKFYNKNIHKTHFGGSLYAMTDPFYVIMLVNILGRVHIVWDKSAFIEFIKPGTGEARTVFQLTKGQIEQIIKKCDEEDEYIPEF